MNDKQLDCFISLAQTLSFSKTAKMLYTTQPNVSHHIQILENELGVSLIERNTKSVKLTEAGVHFLKHAHNIKNAMDSALNSLRPYVEGKEVTIGFPGSMLLYNMERYTAIIEAVEKEFPEYTLRPVVVDGEDKTMALEDNTCDLVITKLIKGLPKNYDYDIIKDQHNGYVLTSDKSPLNKKDTLTIEDIKDYTVYIIQNETSFNPSIKKQLEKTNRIQFYPTYETTLPLIKKDKGIAILHEAMSLDKGLSLIPIDLFDNYKIACVYKKDKPVLKKISLIVQKIHRKI